MPLPQYILSGFRDCERALNTKSTESKKTHAENAKPGPKTNERTSNYHHVTIEEESLSGAEDEGFSTSPFHYLTKEAPFASTKDENPVLVPFDFLPEVAPYVIRQSENPSLLPLGYQAKEDPFISTKNKQSSPYVFKHQTREAPLQTKNKPISRFLFTYQPEEPPLPPAKATEKNWRTALEINVPIGLIDGQIAAFQEHIYPLASPGFELQLLTAGHGDTRVIKVQVLHDAADEQVDVLRTRIQHLVSSLNWGEEKEKEDQEEIKNQEETLHTANQETTGLTDLDHWNQNELWNDVEAEEWIKIEAEEWLAEDEKKQLLTEIEAVVKIEESIYARLRKSKNYKVCEDLVERNWDSLRDYHHLVWYCSVWANWMDRTGEESGGVVPKLAAGKVDRRR